MKHGVVWALGMALAGTVFAETSLDRVVRVFDGRACGGCHSQPTAALAHGRFTLEGGRPELLKSFAYRHRAMQDRVVAGLGVEALPNVPTLVDPTIDPRKPTALATFIGSITHSDSLLPEDEEALYAWVRAGAPLPRETMDAVYDEIRLYEEAVRRNRR